jgi:hypothetical protein
VIGHLSALTMVVFLAEVHPFGSVTEEPIAIDIVSPAEAGPPPRTEEPAPKPQPAESSSPPAGSPLPAAAAEAPAQPPQQPALSTPPDAGVANEPSQPPPVSASPGYRAAEPDLSIKYQVLLGLPQDLSPSLSPSLPHARSEDAFDGQATKAADIAATVVTEFRRRLKTCAKLPAAVAPSDKIKIKLRVFMTPEGRLAAEPILIEASASAKGPALMQSAISALQACQPYAMLPADRYGEWKVLDLSFTPQDFAGAS